MMLAEEFNSSAWLQICGLIFATLVLLAVTIIILAGKTVPKVMSMLVLVAFIALGVVPSWLKFRGFRVEFEQKEERIREVQADADASNRALIAARESLAAARNALLKSEESESQLREQARGLQEQLAMAKAEPKSPQSDPAAAPAERELPDTEPSEVSRDDDAIWSSWANKDQEHKIDDIDVAVTVIKFHWNGWVTGSTKSFGKAVTVKLALPGAEPYEKTIGERRSEHIGIGQHEYMLVVDEIKGQSGNPQAKLSLRKKPGKMQPVQPGLRTAEDDAIWSSWANKDQEHKIDGIDVAVTVVKFHWKRWSEGIETHYGNGVTIKLALPGVEPYTRIVGEHYDTQFGIGQHEYMLVVDEIKGQSGNPQAKLSLRKKLKAGP